MSDGWGVRRPVRRCRLGAGYAVDRWGIVATPLPWAVRGRSVRADCAFVAAGGRPDGSGVGGSGQVGPGAAGAGVPEDGDDARPRRRKRVDGTVRGRRVEFGGRGPVGAAWNLLHGAPRGRGDGPRRRPVRPRFAVSAGGVPVAECHRAKRRGARRNRRRLLGQPQPQRIIGAWRRRRRRGRPRPGERGGPSLRVSRGLLGRGPRGALASKKGIFSPRKQRMRRRRRPPATGVRRRIGRLRREADQRLSSIEERQQ
mmetsp:Transcript_4004/g.13081  ORF Transcript_4004/g.13081 Transcript_4004/m.13081 type:complete len:256 (-) Transcript_4004:844-1611(-)